MAFTPRADEIRAVVDILTSTTEDGGPAYPDETAMGKAIVRAVAARLVERELFAIVPEGGAGLGWGPYWTRTEAENAWRGKGIGECAQGRAGLLRVFPWSPPIATVAETVCTCGHHRDNHVQARRRTTVSYRECGRCKKCPAYIERTDHA